MAMRTIIEARKRIYELLGKRRLTDVNFVLCEDASTVMVYVDTADEQDAVAIYFDLRPDEEFAPQLHRHEFFRRQRPSLVIVGGNHAGV
jgi:hypothetical protein